MARPRTNLVTPRNKWRKGDPVKPLNPNPDMLEGLPAIASFMGKSAQTIAIWIKKHGFPATKTPGGTWLTHKELVFRWIIAGHRAEIAIRSGSPMEYLQAEDSDLPLERRSVEHPNE